MLNFLSRPPTVGATLVSVRRMVARRDPEPAPTRTRLLLRIVMGTAVVGTVIGLVIVERVGTSYRDGLVVAEDAAAVAATAADPATGLTAELAQLTRSLGDTLEQVQALADTAATSTASIAEAARTNLADSVEGTAQVADRVASVIEAIERFIPGDTKSLAEELRTVADGLEPVPGQLRALGTELEQGSADLEASIATLAAVQQRIPAIADGIDETTEALAGLPAVARTLEASARAARERVDVDLWLFRLAVVLAGAAVFLLALAIERWLPRSVVRTAANDAAVPGGTQPSE